MEKSFIWNVSHGHSVDLHREFQVGIELKVTKMNRLIAFNYFL